MHDPLDQLLSRDDVALTDPADPADVRALARQYDGPLPEPLLALWRRTDGLDLEAIVARILGPGEIVQLLADVDYQWDLTGKGILPILDDRESNYLAARVAPPLAPRIIFMQHDDAARLIYRDVGGLFRSLDSVLDLGLAACDFYRDAEGDYSPDAPRTAADRAAARALMATPDGDDTGAWNYAAQLLDAADVDGFARLLETDHFVRRDVVARMKEMSSPAIAELLRRDRQAFEAFTTALADAARRAGFSVGRRDGDSLQVEDHWWNLESFFNRRNGRDAMRRMIAWIDDAAHGRDPRARAGHFMAD